MILVKICGITRVEDALEAVRWGADAIGLVLAPDSPRRVSIDRARRIRQEVAGRIACVGIFQDQPAADVRRLAGDLDLDYLQFHGTESPEYCREFGDRGYKAFWLRPELTRAIVAGYGNPCFLLDGVISSWDSSFPGRDEEIDWDRIRELGESREMILAGGLNPDNVADAVRKVRPYGVDVSRGVEARPGKKDPRLIRSFLDRVRNCDIGGGK